MEIAGFTHFFKTLKNEKLVTPYHTACLLCTVPLLVEILYPILCMWVQLDLFLVATCTLWSSYHDEGIGGGGGGIKIL